MLSFSFKKLLVIFVNLVIFYCFLYGCITGFGLFFIVGHESFYIIKFRDQGLGFTLMLLQTYALTRVGLNVFPLNRQPLNKFEVIFLTALLVICLIIFVYAKHLYSYIFYGHMIVYQLSPYVIIGLSFSLVSTLYLRMQAKSDSPK